MPDSGVGGTMCVVGTTFVFVLFLLLGWLAA